MSVPPRFVLAPDVEIRDVATIPAGIGRVMEVPRTGLVLSRVYGRTAPCLVDARVAPLLERFRRPTSLEDALRGEHAAVPVLARLVARGYLVLAGDGDAAPVTAMLRPGDRLDRFVVRRCVHLLEDCEVHEARADDGARVALKLARPDARTASARLHREAEMLRRVGGAPAPAYLGSGVTDGRAWLAMTWSAGTPATEHATSGALGTLPPREWRARIAAVCEATARAYARLHASGVLHGDVHAGNVLLAPDDGVTLIDFGNAAAIDGGRPAPRTWFAEHVEPELATAALADREIPPSPAGEQYALATLLYRLVVGRPYLALRADRVRALRQTIADPPRPFAEARLRWPAMERVLRRALSKRPRDRFPDMATLADALGDVAAAARSPQDGSSPRSTFVVTDTEIPQVRACPPLAGAAAAAHAARRAAERDTDPALLAAAERWARRARGGLASYVRALVASAGANDEALRSAALELTRALERAPDAAPERLLAAARVRELLPPRATAARRLAHAARRAARTPLPDEPRHAVRATLARLAWHRAAGEPAPAALVGRVDELLCRTASDPRAGVGQLCDAVHLAAERGRLADGPGRAIASRLRERLDRLTPGAPTTARAAHALLRAYREWSDEKSLTAARRLVARARLAPPDRAVLAGELAAPERARAPLLESERWTSRGRRRTR